MTPNQTYVLCSDCGKRVACGPRCKGCSNRARGTAMPSFDATGVKRALQTRVLQSRTKRRNAYLRAIDRRIAANEV